MYKCGEVANNSQLAFKQLLPLFKKYLRKQETMVAMALNARYHAIGKPWRVSLGTLNQTETHPRDLFREAVKRNAYAVIIAHNHPSGDVEPSKNDELLTSRMKEAGNLIGISLLDHLIVADNKYWSFSDEGKL